MFGPSRHHIPCDPRRTVCFGNSAFKAVFSKMTWCCFRVSSGNFLTNINLKRYFKRINNNESHVQAAFYNV